jgi:hypothetical protein
MHSTAKLFALSAVLVFVLTGCQSHQAKIDALQKEYDRLGQQFRQDCSGEMLSLPSQLSQKCAEESKKVTDAWNQLQAERAKK